MPEEKQEGMRKSKIYLVALLGGILALIGYSRVIKPWREHRYLRSLAVQDSNLPAKVVDEYLDRGIKWGDINELNMKGVNISNLEILLNDEEVIEKSKSRDYDFDISCAIRSIVNNENFDWDEYHKWRERGGGAVTLVKAKKYFSLNDLLNIPFILTESTLYKFDLYRIPSDYSLPLLLGDVDPGVIGFFWMNGEVSSKYALTLRQYFYPYEISSLWQREIPITYALPLAQGGKGTKEIANMYSLEKTGESDEVRQKYRGICMPLEYKKDNNIRMWAENGMIPDYLREISKEGAEYVTAAFKLVEQDKLKRKIWDKWRPEVSIDDTLFGIEKGYSKEMAMRAFLLGRSLRELDQDVLYHPLVDEVRRERELIPKPVLNGAPK